VIDSTNTEWNGYTDITQEYQTTLIAGYGADNLLEIYARCVEPTGEFTRLKQHVTVEPSSDFSAAMQLRQTQGNSYEKPNSILNFK